MSAIPITERTSQTLSFAGELHNTLLAQLQQKHPRVAAGEVTEREFNTLLRTGADACIADGIADAAAVKRVLDAILKLLRVSGLIVRRRNTTIVDFGNRTSLDALLALARAAETAGTLPRGLRTSLEMIANTAERAGIDETLAFARRTLRAPRAASERILGELFLATYEASDEFWAARPRWVTILADALGGAVGGAAGAFAGGVVGAGIGAGLLGAAASHVFS